MHKLVILINAPTEDDRFENGWPAFLHYAEKMPGLVRETTSRVTYVLFGETPYTMVHELYFASRAAVEEAMQSEPGRQAGIILQRITNGKFSLFFADHHEDTAENLAKLREDAK